MQGERWPWRACPRRARVALSRFEEGQQDGLVSAAVLLEQLHLESLPLFCPLEPKSLPGMASPLSTVVVAVPLRWCGS